MRYEIVLQFDAPDDAEAETYAKELRTCSDLPPWAEPVTQVSLRKVAEVE